MPYLNFATQINDELGVQRAAKLKKLIPNQFQGEQTQITQENFPYVVYKDNVLSQNRFMDSSKALTFVKDKINSRLAQDTETHNPFVFRDVIFDIEKSLFNDFRKIFLEIPDCLKINFPNLIKTLETGAYTGIKIVGKTLLTVAHKIQEDFGKVTKDLFLKKAKESYEFVEELTRLSISTIAPFEFFLDGVNLAPAVYQLPDEIIEIMKAVGIGKNPKEIYNDSIQLHNLLNKFLASSSPKTSFFKTDFFDFHAQGSLDVKESAIREFLQMYNVYYQKIIDMKNIALNTFCGNPKDLIFTETTNLCPARGIAVDDLNLDSSKENASLTKALYDYFILQIQKIPMLDEALAMEAAWGQRTTPNSI